MNTIGRRVAVVGASAAIGLGVYHAPNLNTENHDPTQAPQAQAANVAEAGHANHLNDTERAIFAGLIALSVAGMGLALSSEEAMRDPRTRGYS